MLSRIVGLAFAFAFLIAGCSSGPTQEQIEATVSARLTLVATPPATLVSMPTAIPQSSEAPKPTSTSRPTSTPKPTATLELTQVPATAQLEPGAAQEADRTDGIWLVGVDIAPGTWRNNGIGDRCYWKRSDKLQETIDNHAGLGGGAVTILPSDFQFETRDCGTWTYLDLENPKPEPDATQEADRTDGIWLVGVDIAPGTWRNNGTGDRCYWKRSDKLQEIIDNHAGLGGGAVTILPSDFQFETHDCGTWTYLGN